MAELGELAAIFGNALAFGYIDSSYSETMFDEVAALLRRVRAEAVADELREIERKAAVAGNWTLHDFMREVRLIRECWAAGSVPVATPPTCERVWQVLSPQRRGEQVLITQCDRRTGDNRTPVAVVLDQRLAEQLVREAKSGRPSS